jgi:hypothetical protein
VRRHELELLVEADQRQQAAAEAVDRSTGDELDAAAGVLAGEADELEDADLRDRVPEAGAPDREGRDDRQRQRDRQPQGGPVAGRRRDVDRAADRLDPGLDHVHADAAARDVGDLAGGREAGQEDELRDVARCHLRELGLRDEALLHRLRGDPLGVDAAAVVDDLEVDLAGLVVGAELQRPLGGLAPRDAVVRQLDAVVDRVADQVGQRVLDGLEHAAVELGVPALHLELHLLAELAGEVPDDAREPGPHRVHGLHAGLHDLLLQLAGDEAEPLRRPRQRGVLVVVVLEPRHELVAGEHELAHHPHQRVEQLDVDPDRALDDGASRVLRLQGTLHRGPCRGPVLDEDRADRAGVPEALLHARDLDGVRRRVAGPHEDLADRRRAGGGTGRVGRGVGGRPADPDRRDRRPLRSPTSSLRGGLAGGLLRGRGGRTAERLGARRGDLRRRLGLGLHVLQEGGQRVDEAGEVDVALGAGGLDALQQAADGVHHAEQRARAVVGELDAAVAEPAQQVLADVGQLLQPVERQEAARALDRVDRPEDAGQELPGVRVLLEGQEIPVELVEVLVRLDQELGDDLVHRFHRRLTPHAGRTSYASAVAAAT